MRPFEVHTSFGSDGASLQAWAADYIRHGRRLPWQEQLRDEIRIGFGQLSPSKEQVLHATFFGAKPANSDIENLVLYNIEPPLGVAGANGIRLEGQNAPPTAPSGVTYPFCYRYKLMPRQDSFTGWHAGRTLASFDSNWINLGTFSGDKTLAQLWLALAQGFETGDVQVHFPALAPETPFAVKVKIRAPRVHSRVLGNLVKGVFDGVVSAFQAQTDTADLPVVTDRLAQHLPALPVEVKRHLLNQRRAVLGTVDRLVLPHASNVQWNPSDHLCMAGELLAADPELNDGCWAIKGEVIEIHR